MGDEVGRELSVANPEDGVLILSAKASLSPSYSGELTEDEDFACLESTLKLVNEMIVPWDRLSNAVRCAPCRLWGIQIARLDHDTDSLECIGNNLALRRANDV